MYFIRRRIFLLKRFRKLAQAARLPLASQWGAETAEEMVTEAEGHFDALLPHLPDAGWRAPHLRSFLLITAAQLALFKAMEAHGKTAREAWLICLAVTERELFGLPTVVKWVAKVGFFSWFSRWSQRRLAAASQVSPVGGNVFDYVPGDGRTFDFGITYRRCATHQLMLAHGGAELAPYLCLGDIPCSDALGWGIQRTSTLAQGCTRCDFRFKKGGPTKITPEDWPAGLE